jgi:hypothetical protein
MYCVIYNSLILLFSICRLWWSVFERRLCTFLIYRSKNKLHTRSLLVIILKMVYVYFSCETNKNINIYNQSLQQHLQMIFSESPLATSTKSTYSQLLATLAEDSYLISCSKVIRRYLLPITTNNIIRGNLLSITTSNIIRGHLLSITTSNIIRGNLLSITTSNIIRGNLLSITTSNIIRGNLL